MTTASNVRENMPMSDRQEQVQDNANPMNNAPTGVVLQREDVYYYGNHTMRRQIIIYTCYRHENDQPSDGSRVGNNALWLVVSIYNV